MDFPFAGAPNIHIVRLDDWIEITAHCIWSGSEIKYTFYPNGIVIQELVGWNEYATMGMFQALSEIADMVTSNFSALYDRLDHPEAYSE